MKRFVLLLLIVIPLWAVQPRAICPVCHRDTALTTRGKFYSHSIVPKQTCPGSATPYNEFQVFNCPDCEQFITAEIAFREEHYAGTNTAPENLIFSRVIQRGVCPNGHVAQIEKEP